MTDWYKEKAREIVDKYCFGRGLLPPEDCIAAALREAAAREQEACGKWHDEQAADAMATAKRHKDFDRLKMSIRFALVRVIHEESAPAIRARKE